MTDSTVQKVSNSSPTFRYQMSYFKVKMNAPNSMFAAQTPVGEREVELIPHFYLSRDVNF